MGWNPQPPTRKYRGFFFGKHGHPPPPLQLVGQGGRGGKFRAKDVGKSGEVCKNWKIPRFPGREQKKDLLKGFQETLYIYIYMVSAPTWAYIYISIIYVIYIIVYYVLCTMYYVLYLYLRCVLYHIYIIMYSIYYLYNIYIYTYYVFLPMTSRFPISPFTGRYSSPTAVRCAVLGRCDLAVLLHGPSVFCPEKRHGLFGRILQFVYFYCRWK